MSHRSHPLMGTEAILYDDCERCAEHAEHLVSLDATNIRLMWDLMIAVEKGGGSGYDRYRTEAERQAGNNLYRMKIVMQKLNLLANRL